MGIAASMLDFGRVVIVCQMQHELPHNDTAYECFHYDKTLAVLPLPGNNSSIVLTLSAEHSQDVLKMDAETFNEDITRRFDHRFGAMKLTSKRHPYPLVAVYAKQFVTTRFALIGDAAVGMHPVTAHGFNLGLSGANTRYCFCQRSGSLPVKTPSPLAAFVCGNQCSRAPLHQRSPAGANFTPGHASSGQRSAAGKTRDHGSIDQNRNLTHLTMSDAKTMHHPPEIKLSRVTSLIPVLTDEFDIYPGCMHGA